MNIAEHFNVLGEPGREGYAFAITRVALGEECGGNLEKLPRPAYAHGIWLDEVTENFVVVRANADGSYWDGRPRDNRDAGVRNAWVRLR